MKRSRRRPSLIFEMGVIECCQSAAMAEGSAQQAATPCDALVAEPVVPEAAKLATLTAARDGSQKDLALALELAPATLHARDSRVRAF